MAKSKQAYVFMTPSIVVLGGAERYLQGKTMWLQDDWDVYIVGPCPVDPYLSYGDAHLVNFEFMNVRPSTVLPTIRLKLLSPLIEVLRCYDRVFIESSTINFSFWGECVAQIVGAEHLIFHLSEDVPRVSESERRYLRDKLCRSELFFIKGEFAAEFGGNNADEHRLRAYMPPAIQDIDFDLSSYRKDRFRIGCVSRLDKPFLVSACRELADYAKKRPEFDFELLVVGGKSEPGDDEDRLKDVLVSSTEGEFSILFTGPLSPVPSSLVDTFDFGIGKSGGAFILADYGLPTATYSMDSDEPMGILGIDFDSNPVSGDGAPKCLAQIIDFYLNNQETVRHGMHLNFDLSNAYTRHFDAFRRCVPEDLPNPLAPDNDANIKERCKGLLLSILGPKRYVALKGRFR